MYAKLIMHTNDLGLIQVEHYTLMIYLVRIKYSPQEQRL